MFYGDLVLREGCHIWGILSYPFSILVDFVLGDFILGELFLWNLVQKMICLRGLCPKEFCHGRFFPKPAWNGQLSKVILHDFVNIQTES